MRDDMKFEAGKRMRILNISEKTISDFEKHGIVRKSIAADGMPGKQAELTPEEKQMVEVRGNAKKVLIYHMTKHEIGDFDVYSMYYVGPDADEWAEEREELMKVRMGSNTCQAKALVEIPQFNVVTAYSTEVWPVNGGLMRMA